MKKIAKFGFIGAVGMPFAFLVFVYAYGLTFRPEDMTIRSHNNQIQRICAVDASLI